MEKTGGDQGEEGWSSGILVHCVKMCGCDWCNEKLNGRRYMAAMGPGVMAKQREQKTGPDSLLTWLLAAELEREPPWRLQQQDWGQASCQKPRIAKVKGEPLGSQACCDPESWQTEFSTQLSVRYMTIPLSIIQIISGCLEFPPNFRITILLIP